MLSISHAVTGAAIAYHLGDPLLATPLILSSHYLLDAIPHWDVGTGLGNGSKSIKLAVLHEIPDLLLAIILIFLFFPSSLPVIASSSLTIPNSAPLWGAFIALIPDFLEGPRNFLRWEPKWLKPINRFHHSFHNSIPRMLDGLSPQLLLLTLLWISR